MCRCIYDTIRSIPIFSMLGFGISLVGCGMAFMLRDEVDKAFETLGMTREENVLSYIWVLFSVTLLLNMAALLSAIPATGKTRELCFSRRESSLVGCIQCLIGPTTQALIFLALCCSFLLLLGCVVLFLPSTTLLVLASGACKAGAESISALAKALENVDNDELKSINAEQLQKFCSAGLSITYAAGMIVAGAVICTIGQVWLLVTSSNNFVRLRLQPELADPERPLAEAMPADALNYYGTTPAFPAGQQNGRAGVLLA